MDVDVEGNVYEDIEWPATMDLWHGELSPAIWSAYGVLIAEELVPAQSFYCPSAQLNWVSAWDAWVEEVDEDPIFRGAFDSHKVGVDGLLAMSTYYQRSVATGSPDTLATSKRKAIVSDGYHVESDGEVINSHRGGVNAVYTDTSVQRTAVIPGTSVAYEDEDYLIDAGWLTWANLDDGS